VAFAAMGLVVVAGIVLAVMWVMPERKNPEIERQQQQERERPIRDDGPGSLFPKTEAKDPSR